MKALLTTLLVGAAVAGVVYYLKDNESVKKLIGDVKDKAEDAYGKISDNISQTVKRSGHVMADQA